MELVLVVLTPAMPAAGTGISPQILADILWANADPIEGLQHINARRGPEPGDHTIGFFLVPDTAPASATADTVLGLCRRAIRTAPALSGWSVALYRIPQHSLDSPDAFGEPP
ncbi:MAG: hypothetical protein HOY69_26840 [Streptomyces sp.]|nr:hypothetical protein [Streptomyces sp.]